MTDTQATGLGTPPANLATEPDGKSAAGSTTASQGSETKAPAAINGSQVASQLAAAGSPGSEGYKIGPHDVLDITVFKVPDLTKSVQVADTGSVNLPLVGEVPAAGRTPQEVERDLTKRLGSKYLQNPQVSVYVKEFNSRRVTIEGAVKKPGVLPYRGDTSLLQVIAMSDGLSENSDSTVVIFRQADGKRTAARFDVAAIRSGTADDPQVKAGDVIVAGSSALKEGFNNILKVLPVGGVFMGLI